MELQCFLFHVQDTAKVLEDKRKVVENSIGIHTNFQLQARENGRHEEAFRRAICDQKERAVGQSSLPGRVEIAASAVKW